jgi:hypothetical protein
MPCRELLRLTLRPAARNRDSDATVVIDPQHIPPCTSATDEHGFKGCERYKRRERCNGYERLRS